MASFTADDRVPDPTQIRQNKEPRSIPANRSLETLFQDISSTASGAGKYLYNSAKEDITNQAENVVELQNAQVGQGVEGAIRTGRSQLASQGVETNAIAENPELQSAQGYVQKVQAARQQGIIPDSLYWAQLNIKAKELRSRYPGWDEEINQIFDEVTGNHRLESRMRMATDEEQKRLQAGGGKEDPEQKRIDADYQKFNGLIADKFPNEYKNWYQLPKEKQLDVLQNVAKIDGMQKNDEAAIKHIELVKAQGGDTRQMTKSAYYAFANNAAAIALRTKGPNGSSESMVKQLADMNQPGYQPKGQTIDALNQHLGQAEIDLKQQFLEARKNYPGLDPEDADKAERSALEPIQAMKKMAGGNDWTLLNRYSALMKYQTEHNLSSLSDKLPWVAQGLLAKELGTAAEQAWSYNYSGSNTTLQKALGPANSLALGSGEQSFDEMMNSLGKDQTDNKISPQDKADAMANAAKSVDRMYGGGVPKDTIVKFVDKNFSNGGSGLRDYMASLTGTAKSQFFDKMTSSNMVKAVLDSGSPKAVHDYESWMVDQFGSLPNSINVGNRIKQMNAASGSVAAQANTYSYNPATYRFTVNPSPASQLPGNQANVTVRNLQKATDTFNNDLYGLANFMRRLGVDPNGPDGISKVLKNLEITNPNVDFKAFQKAISQGAIKGPESAADSAGQSPGRRVAEEDSEGTTAAPEATDLSGESTYPRKEEKLAAVNGFIWHHTGSAPSPEGKYPTPSNIIQVLNQRGLGVQYVMDRDGKIYRALPDGSRGAHILPSEINDLNNSNTEGMEVIAADDKDITPAQVKAAKEFAKEFSKKHPGVQYFGHGEVNPSHKMADEGKTITDAIRGGQLPDEFPSDAYTPVEHRSLLDYAHQNVDASGPDDLKASSLGFAGLTDAPPLTGAFDQTPLVTAAEVDKMPGNVSTNIKDRRDGSDPYEGESYLATGTKAAWDTLSETWKRGFSNTIDQWKHGGHYDEQAFYNDMSDMFHSQRIDAPTSDKDLLKDYVK